MIGPLYSTPAVKHPNFHDGFMARNDTFNIMRTIHRHISPLAYLCVSLLPSDLVNNPAVCLSGIRDLMSNMDRKSISSLTQCIRQSLYSSKRTANVLKRHRRV